jgi:hypothetical protein
MRTSRINKRSDGRKEEKRAREKKWGALNEKCHAENVNFSCPSVKPIQNRSHSPGDVVWVIKSTQTDAASTPLPPSIPGRAGWRFLVHGADARKCAYTPWSTNGSRNSIFRTQHVSRSTPPLLCRRDIIIVRVIVMIGEMCGGEGKRNKGGRRNRATASGR